MELPTPPSFESFPKIPRFYGDLVITEKIDGTNAQILITEDGDLFAGSRNRWLSAEADNFGFHAWVMAHRDALLELGPGRHYGEWWGSGIQRGYGLPKGEKRFSLFNVSRWRVDVLGDSTAPNCCSVVPVLGIYPMDTESLRKILETLRQEGSVAAPGFMNPEGAMIFHVKANTYFKAPFDPAPKTRNQ